MTLFCSALINLTCLLVPAVWYNDIGNVTTVAFILLNNEQAEKSCYQYDTYTLIQSAFSALIF
jgi:hypothetical protein